MKPFPMPPLPPAADLDHVLAKVGDAFEELRGGRLFVTGGTGFFGKWIAHSFINACDRYDLRAEMVLLARNPEGFREAQPILCAHPAIRLWQGDMDTFAFPEGKFSHILHLAVEPFSLQNPKGMLGHFKTNMRGNERILDLAARCGVKKFLFTSSGAVYGKQPATLPGLPEDHPVICDLADPLCAYSTLKRSNEYECTAYGAAHDFEAKIARCFAFVGPYLPLDAAFAVGNFVGDVLSGRPIVIKGDGTPYRSYLYGADLAAWLWTILFRGVNGRPYNTGADRAVSIRELAEIVARVGGREGDFQVLGTPKPGVPPLRYVPSIERARSELSLDAWTSLEEGLARTFTWYGKPGS